MEGERCAGFDDWNEWNNNGDDGWTEFRGEDLSRKELALALEEPTRQTLPKQRR
jgi:hypothetical protein